MFVLPVLSHFVSQYTGLVVQCRLRGQMSLQLLIVRMKCSLPRSSCGGRSERVSECVCVCVCVCVCNACVNYFVKCVVKRVFLFKVKRYVCM